MGLITPNKAKQIWVFPKIEVLYPKMYGENNGKPNVLMDDLEGFPPH